MRARSPVGNYFRYTLDQNGAGGMHGSKAGDWLVRTRICPRRGEVAKTGAGNGQKQRANVSPQNPRFVLLEAAPVICVA
jgi:hypothetical protein